MKQLLVTKGTIAYAYDTTAGGDIDSAWDLDTLDEGALAAFEYDGDDAGTLIDDVTPTISSTCNCIYFGLGTAESRAIITPPLYRDGFSYVKDEYVAPVAGQIALGDDNDASATAGLSLNLPASLSAGDTYGIYVIDLEKEHGDLSRMKHYSVDYATGDLLTGQTSLNVVAKLVAAITADSNAIVTATAKDSNTANYTGILFEAATAGHKFAIALDSESILANATISWYKYKAGTYDGSYTVPTQHVTGSGTPTQITALLQDCLPHDGWNNSNLLGGTLWTESSPVVSSATYTLYTIKSTAPPTSKLEGENPISFTLYIAAPSGDTAVGKTIAALDTILATV